MKNNIKEGYRELYKNVPLKTLRSHELRYIDRVTMLARELSDTQDHLHAIRVLIGERSGKPFYKREG